MPRKRADALMRSMTEPVMTAAPALTTTMAARTPPGLTTSILDDQAGDLLPASTLASFSYPGNPGHFCDPLTEIGSLVQAAASLHAYFGSSFYVRTTTVGVD